MKEASNHHKIAFKAATTLLADENKKANGMSANSVIDHIKKEYGVTIARTTLSRYVREGVVGTSPKNNSNPGRISEWGFQTLCTATSSFILINQLNSREFETEGTYS